MYILQNFYFPQPEGHTETFQLTYVPQVLAEYIQYQYILILDIYWIYMNVELTNISKLLAAYSIQMYISPSRAPEGHTETLQLTYIPQLLQNISIYNINLYIQLTNVPAYMFFIICIFLMFYMWTHGNIIFDVLGHRKAHISPFL